MHKGYKIRSLTALLLKLSAPNLQQNSFKLNSLILHTRRLLFGHRAELTFLNLAQNFWNANPTSLCISLIEPESGYQIDHSVEKRLFAIFDFQIFS